MQLNIYVVDAFSRQLFGGNAAAVIVLEQWLEATQLQLIAAENNLSETAFIVKVGDRFHIRWFSPVREIDFCGHATLASAFVLFKQAPNISHLDFYAAAVGNFSVSKQADGLISMSFAARTVEPLVEPPQALIDGLSIPPKAYWLTQQAYFVEYSTEQQVKDVVPDTALLANLQPLDVVVTAPASGQYDFISRYFWPDTANGEDPVTGSIHTALAPFWATRLGKAELNARQASARGGDLFCRVSADNVVVSGYATLYLQGVINLED